MKLNKWNSCILGDVVKYANSRISVDKLSAENYISTENMLPNRGGIVLASSLPTGNAVKYYKGQTLVSNIRPYFKKIWHAKNDGGCSADVLVFEIINDVDDKFFYYYLSQENFFEYVMAGSKGTKMPRGDKQQILMYPFSYPSKKEQKAIAATLSCLDDKIELNNRMNKNLEEMAQAIFKIWFVDFEPFQDGEFEESELGMIPKGWRVKKLEDVCDEIVRGFTSKYVEKSKFKNLNQKVNKGSYLDKQYYKYLREDIEIPESKFAKKYDILINSLGQGTLGRVHLFTEDENNIVIDQHITILRANNSYINSCFLYFTMISNEIQNRIEGMITGSTGMLMLNISKIRSMNVIVPPIDVVKNFESTVKSLMEYKAYLNKQSDILGEKRDTLLPKLMSGEIRVPIEEVQ